MILNEFKAWFEGITATMGPVPTIEQWDLIKKEIAAIGFDKVAAKAAQGPFVAQGEDVKKELPKETIADIFKRLQEEKQKGTGIPGFPDGWPSKHDRGWPYDPRDDKHWLSKLPQGFNSGLSSGISAGFGDGDDSVVFLFRGKTD